MIKKLRLQNFKCFQHPKPFEFSKLNLLTGINGRGKSSLLQAILLISQSVETFSKTNKLKLNGRHINLGNFDDIKNSETPRGESLYIEIDFDETRAKFQFSENENDSMTALVNDDGIIIHESIIQIFNTLQKGAKDFQTSVIENIGKIENVDLAKESDLAIEMSQIPFNYHISNIHFISADRLGPVKYVDKTSLSDFISVGPRGEFTINVLAEDNHPLVNDILYIGNDAKSVKQQTEEWLGYILEGAKIDIKGREKDSSVLYMLLNNRNNSYGYKPTNVGFGYSYVLPLIVTGLIAQPGQIIIIENPEAHLHPRAQSRISEFFAKVASCGVQVFIESHSEHILNGLRLSALNPQIPIKHDELTINYFNEYFQSEKLTMDDKGKIPNWPNGFFDQQEIDLAEIFKYSR